jgi:hypothetical protein
VSAQEETRLVSGDKEVKEYLATSPQRVDDWLYELVDGAVFFAADRIRAHAPGSIDRLVDVQVPNVLSPGVIEGIAGVEPDITEETFGRGLGSDPADYPVFVEVGTGIFGEVGTPITSIPGHKMGPIIGSDGHFFYTTIVKGQPPQHYTENAFDETVIWMPGHIEGALPDLAPRT